ncbi:MAG: isopentenyl-diphosphate delta-isomerase, partial [Lachnospiraceae bacterium]|nr:isopentenyl-diphosphate delta-isomerase [Lachnospiraceae bacterium]
PDFRRVVKTDAAFAKENRIKMRTDGTDGFSINKSEVDMRYVEQLVDSEQLTALAYMIKSMKLHDFDGKKTLTEAVEGFYKRIDAKGFAVFAGGEYLPGNLAMPRSQELYAAINRCRDLIQI